LIKKKFIQLSTKTNRKKKKKEKENLTWYEEEERRIEEEERNGRRKKQKKIKTNLENGDCLGEEVCWCQITSIGI